VVRRSVQIAFSGNFQTGAIKKLLYFLALFSKNIYHRRPDHQKLRANPPRRINHPTGFPAAMKNAPTRMAAAGPVPARKFGNIVCVTPSESISGFPFGTGMHSSQDPPAKNLRSFAQPTELLRSKRSNYSHLNISDDFFIN
jgi:hypothetical protein